VEDRDKYFLKTKFCLPAARAQSLGTQLRATILNDGREIPAWFTFLKIARELRRSPVTFEPRHKHKA